METQKGAALIVVLSLLTVSLMVGLSSMQSSQIDERLAGNYRAASEAYMVAEISASELLESGKEPVSGKESCVYVADNFDKYDDEWVSLTEDLSLEDYQRASYRSCEYAGHGPAFIVMGEAGDAVRFLAFSPEGEGEGGGNPIKDIIDDFIPDGEELFDYALLVGGALAINGGADIGGSVRVGGAYNKRPNHEVGDLVVNDYVDIISDYGPGGLRPSQEFFSKVEGLEGYDEPVGGCSRNAGNSVIYCQGDASLDFSEIEGKSVVANGSVSVTGTSEGQNVFVVADGSVDFSGMGGNTFRGVVWSGGSLVFNGQGGTSYEGSFVSAGSSVFNGGLNIEQLDFEDAAPTAGGDILWKEI
ncbi:MAG: pilus assembly PilX family protein [Pseudomonadota bacterium]